MDHRAVHPARADAVGPVGVPSVEGRTQPDAANTNTYSTPTVHFHFTEQL